jgi:3-oxoacyl-[acyl-carrier protein] reductase
MADRYQALTGTPVGKLLVKNLGLPAPAPLERYVPGRPAVTGDVLVGGSGRLAQPAAAAVSAAGGAALTDASPGRRLHGAVFDASGIVASDQLIALRDFFTPLMRSLDSCCRLVVLGTPPEHAAAESERVAQRALEGFTRSLGKEVGRGGTVQLVYVSPGAEDRLSSTLAFLLSPKSAYVSGQVIRVGTDL